MTSRVDFPRRRFIRIAVLGAAAAPLVGDAWFNAAAAQELPHLDEADPTANALGYKHDTTKADAAKYPNHKPDQTCANCNLGLGKEGDAWRPCSIFPGKSVSAKGWCAAWVKKV